MPLPHFQTMPLGRARDPFSHPDWLFEVKWDGFRSLVRIEHGACKLMSRNGNQFKSFSVLNESIAAVAGPTVSKTKSIIGTIYNWGSSRVW